MRRGPSSTGGRTGAPRPVPRWARLSGGVGGVRVWGGTFFFLACSIGGPGMDAIADAIAANKTIKEIFLTNQRTVIPSKSGMPSPFQAV